MLRAAPPSTGAVERQTLPPPRFEADCEKTNDAPAWVHARQPQAIVLCPPNCGGGTRSVLGGDGGIYQRDSSICRAALHAGAVNASGGEFTLYYQPLLPSWNNYMEGWCLHSGAGAAAPALRRPQPLPLLLPQRQAGCPAAAAHSAQCWQPPRVPSCWIPAAAPNHPASPSRAFPGSLAHGVESLAANSTVDNAFTFNKTGGYVPCSHLGAEAKPTGGDPAALLAAVREFNISCDRTDGDGALVDVFFPLALITCPANCSTAPSRGVYGRQGCGALAQRCMLAHLLRGQMQPFGSVSHAKGRQCQRWALPPCCARLLTSRCPGVPFPSTAVSTNAPARCARQPSMQG